MKRLKKKSQISIYWVLIEVVIAVMIVSAYAWYVDSVRTNTLPQKKFLARDIALVSNAIYSAPGSLYYWYEPPQIQAILLQKFDYTLKDQKAIIKEKSLETRYPYGEGSFLNNVISLLQKPLKIEFENSNNAFLFQKKIVPKYFNKKYQETETKTDNIILVSGILKNPRTGQEYIEGESYTSQLSFSIQNTKSKLNLQLDKADIKTAFSILEQEQSDIIIGISEDKESKQEIKIYIGSENIKQNRKLASLIANKLSKLKRPIPIIPVESSKNILLIKIGEIPLKEQSSEIGEAISFALKEL